MENEEGSPYIPEELRRLTADLVTSYLTEEPKDFIDHSIRFFREKLYERNTRSKSVVEETIDKRKLAERRASVYSESIDPDTDFKPVVHKKTVIQKKKLIREAKKSVIFETLDDIELIHLANAMQSKPVTKGEYVISQGARGDFMYIIEKGTFEAVKEDDEVLKVYDNEGSFGELALLYNTPRACSVIAKTDGQLWAIDRKTFRQIVLGNQVKKIKRHEILIERVPILSVLTPKQKIKLVDALVTRTYKNGDRIIKEGDFADGMYFIESGRVRVTVKCYDTHEEKDVKILKAGDYFGELGLLMKQPRAASVFALGLTTVAFLETSAFERLLGPCVNLMKQQFEDYKKQIKVLKKKGNVSKNNENSEIEILNNSVFKQFKRSV